MRFFNSRPRVAIVAPLDPRGTLAEYEAQICGLSNQEYGESIELVVPCSFSRGTQAHQYKYKFNRNGPPRITDVIVFDTNEFSELIALGVRYALREFGSHVMPDVLIITNLNSTVDSSFVRKALSNSGAMQYVFTTNGHEYLTIQRGSFLKFFRCLNTGVKSSLDTHVWRAIKGIKINSMRVQNQSIGSWLTSLV